jgi:hypothetical protein
MPERVADSPLGQPGFRHGLPDRFLHQGFINVMASLFLRPNIHPTVFLWKDPLPPPVLRGVGVFPIEGVWKLHPPPPIRHILLVCLFGSPG